MLGRSTLHVLPYFFVFQFSRPRFFPPTCSSNMSSDLRTFPGFFLSVHAPGHHRFLSPPFDEPHTPPLDVAWGTEIFGHVSRPVRNVSSCVIPQPLPASHMAYVWGAQGLSFSRSRDGAYFFSPSMPKLTLPASLFLTCYFPKSALKALWFFGEFLFVTNRCL